MNRGITGIVSDEIRKSTRSSVDYENEETQREIYNSMFPHSLKKLQNKPYLSRAEEYMVKNRLCHGKGKASKRHKKKKKK